jgi:hypothetical protein
LLRVFIDESGGGADPTTPHVVVAGCLAAITSWTAFEASWSETLRAFGIRVHHMQDYAASRGEFGGWKADETRRTEYLRRLVDCIVGMDVHFIAGTVHRSVETLPNAPPRGLGDEGKRYIECLGYVLHSSSAVRNQVAPDDLIEVVVAENDFEWNAYQTYKRLKKWPQPFASFTLGSPRELLPLQAADLYVWELSKHLREPDRSRESWKRLAERPLLNVSLDTSPPLFDAESPSP